MDSSKNIKLCCQLIAISFYEVMVRNCIILGSGRSGTSMVAGTLAKSGYNMGEKLYPPRNSNPKGFFEDPFINGINEQILANIKLRPAESIKRLFAGKKLSEGQRWLEIVPCGTHLYSSASIEEQIDTAVSKSPYCYKDPRFSYTLPVWRPFLKNTVFICVFRAPSVTAQSILKECDDMEYLHSVKMSIKYALNVWYSVYTNILNIHMNQGDWLFIHYDQLLTGEGIRRIEYFVDAIADMAFPDNKLKRTTANIQLDDKYAQIYTKLCELSGYRI